MKKVLNVIGGLSIGGAENSAMNIARYIHQTDFEYEFLVFGDKVGEYEKEAVKNGSSIIRMEHPAKSYLTFFRNLNKILKEKKYDAIHVNTLWNSGIVLKAAKHNHIPVRICHSHSTESSQNENFFYKIYKWFMRCLIKANATQFIACGVDAGEYLYGKEFFKKNGVVIYNGIDIEKYKYNDKVRNEMRNELKVVPNGILLGHVGRLAPVKNHKFIINIFEKLMKEIPNLQLVLVGDGPDKENIQKLIDNKGLKSNILLLGNRLDVHRILLAMDILLFPSFFEGFPVTLVEAQATGLSCIISNKVTKEAQLIEGSYFLPIDQGEEVWIEKIKAIVQKNNDRRNISIHQIIEEFDIKNITKKMELLYNDKY